jgi:hypothetical protein
MEIVAAPARTFKTYSTWLAIAVVLFDGAGGLLETFSSMHLISAATFAAVNAVLVALIPVVKLIKQQLTVTPDQKAAIVADAQAMPVKPTPAPDLAATVASLQAAVAELAKRPP